MLVDDVPTDDVAMTDLQTWFARLSGPHIRVSG
jgi:hypothetical protein